MKAAVGTLLAVSAVMLAVRLLAARAVGFGDSEALYACYAMHPQPAYLDHPGLIGLFARAIGGGTAPWALPAHTLTAVLATVAPWLVFLAARGAGASERPAAAAALGVAVVPEIAVGLFAMSPDLLLFVAWVGALGFAASGLRAEPSSNRAAVCLVLAGLLAGIGCAAKVSAATLVLALVVTYLSRGARGHARTVWPWAGLFLGLLVVSPIVLYEARMGWPMLRHRLVDTQSDAGLSLRNAGALILGQAVYLSPLVVVAAAFLVRDLWRNRRADPTTALFASATFLPLAFLAPLCLWSRVAEPHWIAPALLALPLHLAGRMSEGAAILPRRLALYSMVTAGVFSFVAHLWVLVPGLVALMPSSYDARLDLANELYGWPDAIASVRRAADEEKPAGSDAGALVVAGPHWVICAQLHAALRGDLPVGCAGPGRDDWDDWFPRPRWDRADVVLFVSDDRFEVDYARLFPDRALTSERRVRVMRGGKAARVFTISVLQTRGAA